MRRRYVIGLLGGAAATWPFAGRAQQTDRLRRIGVLMTTARDDSEGRARIAAFLQGLQQLGWTDGHNVQINTRWGAGNADDFRRYAAELVALAPDVIVAPGSVTVEAFLKATRAVPILFVHIADPVGVKQVAPGVKRVAVIRDPAITAGIGQWGAILAVAPSFEVEVSPVNVRDAGDIERSITVLARSANAGLIVTGSSRLLLGTNCPQSTSNATSSPTAV